MKSTILARFSLLIFFAVSCQESAPRSTMRSLDKNRAASASDDATQQGNQNNSGASQNTDTPSGTNTSGSDSQDPTANNNSANNGASNSVANANNASNQQSTSATLTSGGTDLRWMSIGEKPMSSLGTTPDCPMEVDINRAVCSSRNTLCKSNFTAACSDPSTCRRVFKCTTGIGAGNIWFAVGDVYTKGTFTECTVKEHIAGASCTSLDDRCLSSFEITPGKHRLFKCLPSGGPGQLFLRWAWDAPQSGLSGIEECSIPEPLQGKSCNQETYRCISKFCVEGGTAPNCVKRRLLKCTP